MKCKGDGMKSEKMMLAVGMMSGTSLDGLDIAVSRIFMHDSQLKVDTIAAHTYPFEKALKEKIVQATLDQMTASDLCSLNFELADVFSNFMHRFCAEKAIDMKSIDFIASHGQTIYHIGNNSPKHKKSTLQLANGSVIAQLCKKTVIWDFRSADMALGGQGAPLVPYVDYILYKDEHKNRAIHNLGGISNLTIIPKSSTIEQVYAFDTGPANMLIDIACQKLFNQAYDKEGMLARSGKMITSLYDQVLSHPYFNLCLPKSTGREQFGLQYVEDVIAPYKNQPKVDILYTLVHATAKSIAHAYEKYVFNTLKLDEIIFCGGGVYNTFLIDTIKLYISNIEIKTLEALGDSSAYKEAVAFSILGYLTLHGKTSNLPSVTGAQKQTILGSISLFLED